MASDLTVQNINCSSVNGENITKGFNPVLAEYTVTGSPVTSIDFSGLDINAHGGSYEIEIMSVNPTATVADLHIFINGDTTQANYYSQTIFGQGASTGAGRVNNSRLLPLMGTDRSGAVVDVMINNSLPMVLSRVVYGPPSTPTVQNYTVIKTATVSNITQLTFTATTAGTIGVGSKFILRRKDK